MRLMVCDSVAPIIRGHHWCYEQASNDVAERNLLGEWLVWMLVLGHALAALYHHVVKKDDTLRKMTTMKS